MIESLLLFPGMLLHEIAHALACLLLGVRITKAKLWGLGGASITHQRTTGWRNFAVALAPFFVNSSVAVTSFYVGHIGLEKTVFIGSRLLPILLFYWLGISFAYFAFPSEADLRSGWGELWGHYRSRLLSQAGAFAALLCWITLPLLPFAWMATAMLRLLNRPRAGLAWAVVLFLATALYLGV